MTIKQQIKQDVKQKNIDALIKHYEEYYKAREMANPVNDLEALPDYKKKYYIAEILNNRLHGIDRQTAIEILRYYFVPKKGGWFASRPKFDLVVDFQQAGLI